jgi:hypothetical protein
LYKGALVSKLVADLSPKVGVGVGLWLAQAGLWLIREGGSGWSGRICAAAAAGFVLTKAGFSGARSK